MPRHSRLWSHDGSSEPVQNCGRMGTKPNLQMPSTRPKIAKLMQAAANCSSNFLVDRTEKKRCTTWKEKERDRKRRNETPASSGCYCARSTGNGTEYFAFRISLQLSPSHLQYGSGVCISCTSLASGTLAKARKSQWPGANYQLVCQNEETRP